MKLPLIALFIGATIAPVFAQSIADWTFETSLPTNSGPISPESGAGVATGFHTGASTYSTPAGNGSAHSFSSNSWAAGDYYQFEVSSLGLSNLQVSWDQTSSGTGPKDFSFSYSTDGVHFADVGDYTVLANSNGNIWSASTPVTAAGFSYSLGAVLGLNSQPVVDFRLTDLDAISAGGGTVGSGGTDRVDNFAVSAIPEPSSFAAILGCFGLVIGLFRRRMIKHTVAI